MDDLDTPPCPECGADDILPIRYGMPGTEMMREMEEGKAVLGGCVIDEDAPVWLCRACNHKFGRLGAL
ncbi:MAG: hypothetical protein OEZ55_06715 [Nitrospinota bacterium]|nr:hypothetical protein [Nitrospinota bacterium]